MCRREINLRECTKDMEIIIKSLVWSFSTKGLKKRDLQLLVINKIRSRSHHETSELSCFWKLFGIVWKS